MELKKGKVAIRFMIRGALFNTLCGTLHAIRFVFVELRLFLSAPNAPVFTHFEYVTS